MNNMNTLLRAGHVILILLLIVALTACAGRRDILGIPPSIQIAQLQLHEDHAILALRLRNGNDEVLTGGKLQFQLNISGRLFAVYNGTPDIDIIAHSAEELRVRIRPLRQEALDELRAMAGRGQGNVQWEMNGSLELDQKNQKPLFSYTGRLFPVPGRDDLFR